MNRGLINSLIFSILFFFNSKTFAQIEGVTEFDTSNISTLLDQINLDSTQIVILGEEAHYDGVAMTLNQKIISELVQKYGFTTLLLESDFESLLSIQKMIKKHHEIDFNNEIKNIKGEEDHNLTSNIYKSWVHTKEFKRILELYYSDQLEILGFDSKMHGLFVKKHFKNHYYHHLFFKDYKPSEIEEKIYHLVLKSLIENEFKDSTNLNNQQAFLTLISKAQSFYSDTLAHNFQSLKNIKNYALQIWIEKESSLKYMCMRDVNMVCNVDYLLKTELKNKKVIILGANLHIEPGVVKLLDNYVDFNIGDYLKKNYNSISIVPINYKGKRGSYQGVVKIQKPKKFMLANKLHKYKYQFALVDLNKISQETRIYTNELVIPSTYGDYFIFIDKTKPSTFITQ